MRTRYLRWDGEQDPLGARPDVAGLLEQLSDDLLMGSGGRAALDDLRQRGPDGSRGLRALRRELARRRREVGEVGDAGEALAAIAAELDDIVGLERDALAARDDIAARSAELDLDLLPQDPAGRMRGLATYDFASPDAARRFTQLQDQVRRDLLDAHLRSVSDAMSSVTPQDLERLSAMLADLNVLLAARAANGGVAPPGEPERFAAFIAAHGEVVPAVVGEGGVTRPPADLDELLAEMARRAAAAQRFMESLSPRERAQLQDLAAQVFDDLDLQFQLHELGANLRGAYPDGLPGGGGQTPPDGTPLDGGRGPLSRAVDAWERAAELDDLDAALQGAYEGATLEDIDEEALRRHLGDDAVQDVRRLRAIERELERSGAMRVRDGELELTPRGARLLGERALAHILARVRREPATRRTGADPEPTGQTRPWAFGDREPLATSASVRNAVLRRAGEGRPPGSGGLHLQPDDLEVVEQEVRPRTATVLLLDLSFSMPLQGHFVPAKRMALALHALIDGKHRQDSLHLIGFSDYARRMQPADLAAAGFERVYGTNMHHAFLLARRVLADDPRPVKRVIMVTDGEPTAHLVDGQSVFNWPPEAETLEATLREAARLARSGIELDIFLLEDEPGLVAFAERLAALTGGEVSRMNAEAVGDTVVSGYPTDRVR